MANKDVAREIVAELEPSEGWWKDSTEETLVEVAGDMLGVMNAESVQETLESVIGALRNEYGD